MRGVVSVLLVGSMCIVWTACGGIGMQPPAEVAAKVPTSFSNAPYKKLASAAFVDDYAGKGIKVKAMFIGEWTLVQIVEQMGAKIKGRVFINTRSLDYKAAETGLGSSDNEIPDIVVSVPKAKSDWVYEYKRGDIIEITGVTEKIGGIARETSIHIKVISVKKVQ